MKIIEEFIKLNCTKTLYLAGFNENYVLNELKRAMKEYALEIANDAFDAGFAYAVASYSSMKQNQLSKAEYSQKLHKEL